jgi:DNA polymerase-1
MNRLVPEVMSGALKLNVPLKVDMNAGRNWAELKD